VHADQTTAWPAADIARKIVASSTRNTPGIGHEHFEARHAFVHRGVELFDLFVFELGGDEMKAVIDRGFAFGFLVPVVDAFDQ
jgi:hypothetical protein